MGMYDDTPDRCFEELANAIVYQAYEDYYKGLRYLLKCQKREDAGEEIYMKGREFWLYTAAHAEKWMLSQDFKIFTQLNGRDLVVRIRRELGLDDDFDLKELWTEFGGV